MKQPSMLTTRRKTRDQDLLGDFLNIYWLRPEVALFLATTASVLQEAPSLPVSPPSLDLGAGNGLFSFIALGGAFSSEFDVYFNTGDLENFWNNKDIYDHFHFAGDRRMITRVPAHNFTFALDHKENLKKQSLFLNLYEEFRISDANKRWPFEDGELQSVFSNIFYWLRDPEFLFRELSRVLKKGGRGFLALQDPSFPTYCPTFRAEEFPQFQEVLKLLNRGRADSYQWRLGIEELEKLAKRCGLELVYYRRYLSATILKIWDIGLRPLSPVFISMANHLPPEKRTVHKQEWTQIFKRLLTPIFEREKDVQDHGGFLYVIFEKQ